MASPPVADPDAVVVVETVLSPTVGGVHGRGDDDDDDSGSDTERAPRRGGSPTGDAGRGDDGAAAGSSIAEHAPNGSQHGRGSSSTGAVGQSQEVLPSLGPLPDDADQPRRYFVAKPVSHWRFAECLEKQVWSVEEGNVEELNSAIRAGVTAVVFFSVNQSLSLQVGDVWLGCVGDALECCCQRLQAATA